jgi:prevent-host-death family protein
MSSEEAALLDRVKPVQATVSATEVRRRFGEMLKRAHNKEEHLIVERDGFPLAVIVPYDDYQVFMREHARRAFDRFSRALGNDVEGRGITEEQLVENLEDAKKEVFRERYGGP